MEAPPNDFDGMMEGHLSGSFGKRVGNDARRIRFATVTSGFDVMSQVWPHEQHVWSSGPDTGGAKKPRDLRETIDMGPFARVKQVVLRDHPVDVLLVDVGVPVGSWMTWIRCVSSEIRPSVVVAMFPGGETVCEDHGERIKADVRSLRDMGFSCQMFFMQALDYGSSIGQERLVYIFSQRGPCQAPQAHNLPVRSMANLLRDHLVPRRAWAPLKRIKVRVHQAGPYKIAATIGQEPVYDMSGPMPDGDAWVQDSKRVRRLQPAERARALGIESDPSQVPKVGAKLQATTGVHLWAALAEPLAELVRGRSDAPPQTSMAGLGLRDPVVPLFVSDPAEWSWTVPDLSLGGQWWRDRVENLKNAVDGLPDADRLLAEGLAALEVHRGNYTPEGPKRLQLLWWEFPREHQDAVRCGSSMNFMILPTGDLVLNNDLEGEQLTVAAKFVDQLIDLGVLEEADTILANCPLFCVTKAGQVDEWRPIADMKRGGQNQCCASDPVYFQRGHDILNRLYAGGFSAVADQSKYFHNFLTVPAERPYLGTIHPITGKRYVYRGLPMGSSNSPAIACRIGNGFLRVLRAECLAFQGVPVENSWRVRFQGGKTRSELGHGRVLIGEDGLPACWVCAHVDDYLVHGPTKQKTCQAFSAFMDLSVRMGFIVQPSKTNPPAQVQTYCGFEYDSTKRPVLRIPQAKQQRAIACIDYLQQFRHTDCGKEHHQLARLTLAVVLGRLQSLVDATPQQVGQAYLRRIYTEMHITTGDSEELQHAIMLYGSAITLSTLAWADLDWWRQSLVLNHGVGGFGSVPGSAVVTWGDGSGTGGGGTLEVEGAVQQLEFWMGTWAPHIGSFSSNWKELRTLLEMLKREQGQDRLRHGIMFYFTDNLVTYYIVQGGSSTSPELHKLIREIKRLENVLQCQVEVVHVPGRLMICQGADGLSRGVRVVPERMERTTFLEASRVLSAVPYNASWMVWACKQLPVFHALPWRHIGALDSWDFCQLAGHMTFWTPTPEMARQAITCFLQSWCEQPTTMGAVFCIPRVMQRSWGNLSRHILELGVYEPELLPGECNYASLIPVVLLYVPPFVHSLPPDRLDAPPFAPQLPKWVHGQADYLRGL